MKFNTKLGKGDKMYFIYMLVSIFCIYIIDHVFVIPLTHGERIILGLLIFFYFRITYLIKGGEDVEPLFKDSEDNQGERIP